MCAILLQGRSKKDNQEKRDDSDSKLGREPRGKKSSGGRVQACGIGHDKGGRNIAGRPRAFYKMCGGSAGLIEHGSKGNIYIAFKQHGYLSGCREIVDIGQRRAVRWRFTEAGFKKFFLSADRARISRYSSKNISLFEDLRAFFRRGRARNENSNPFAIPGSTRLKSGFSAYTCPPIAPGGKSHEKLLSVCLHKWVWFQCKLKQLRWWKACERNPCSFS